MTARQTNPFGLQANTSWTRDNSKNDFLYNAGSELNTTSGWYETFFRDYDPVLGRFMSVDPLAHIAPSRTAYHYAANNPISYNDPLGLLENPGFDPSIWSHIAALYESDYGGTWSEAGGNHYFQSIQEEESRASALAQMRDAGGGGHIEPMYDYKYVGKSRNPSTQTIDNIYKKTITGYKYVMDESGQTQGGGLKFADLWANYGSGITHTDAKGNSIKEINNYCAINLSETLIENGLSPGGVKCWGNCSTNKRHTLRAQELSDWLQGNLSGVIDITGKDFMDKINGKTGIVFFQNYYGEGMQGDHIDLWNQNEMGSYGVFDTWLRTTIPWLGTLRGMSDLGNSSQILFWEIK